MDLVCLWAYIMPNKHVTFVTVRLHVYTPLAFLGDWPEYSSKYDVS